jgi:hypothetical protein
MRGIFFKVTVVLTAAVLLVPSAARADDPVFVEWSSYLPSLQLSYDPDSANDCTAGREQCVHSVIREMTKRFDDLAATCDHDALFSLTYLRTTEEYHRFWHEGHFSEPGWLNHYDAVFASYYFKAMDDWKKGNAAAVPPAWKVAFEASKNKQVTGSGSMFLGMNAHILRDLPFVIASIGMAKADGTSRKPDHDTVNQFLNRVSDELFPEAAGRFDPTVDDSNVPGTTLDDLALFQLIPSWRENAWRNAEALVNAPNDAARALVAQNIENEALAQALTFKAQALYTPLSSFKASDRDAYCMAHHNDVI